MDLEVHIPIASPIFSIVRHCRRTNDRLALRYGCGYFYPAYLLSPQSSGGPYCAGVLLARSIEELQARGEGIEGTGLLQPLLVVEDGDGYRLIAGERRLRASELVGVENVPSIVTSLDENSIVLAQLIENLQRRDLPPLEEARGIEQLIHQQGLSLRDAAKVLSKSLGYVTNRLSLLKMKPEVQGLVAQRPDTLKHAPILDGVNDETLRAELTQAVLNEDLSVRELQRRLQPEVQPSEQETEPGHEAQENKVFSRKNTSSSTNQRVPPQHTARTHGQGNRSTDHTGDHSADQQVFSHENTSNTSAPENPDPLHHALKPAATFAAEAARVLKNLSLSVDYRREVQRELDNLKKQVARIEKLLE
jgi:ParB/RepB/Spo0J family partition protein